MLRPHWTYIGQIDCFGIAPQRRDSLLKRAMQVVYQNGGELQLACAENLYDTDRYDLHCDLPGRPDVFIEFLRALAHNLPPEHVPIVIEAYERNNLQREDLIIRGGQLRVRPYEWQAGAERPLHLAAA